MAEVAHIMERMEELSETAIVRSAQAGDEGAFTELVVRHRRDVLRIAWRFARNNAELDDLGQEIFIRAFESLASYRGDAPFGHWLSRVAVHACYDFLRRRRREEGNISLDAMPFPPVDPSTETDRPAEQARLILEGAMAQLKPDQRLVITLFELEDRTIREVAALTGWSETGVKVRAFRARKALKRILGGQDEG